MIPEELKLHDDQYDQMFSKTYNNPTSAKGHKSAMPGLISGNEE
jgi:hypothetical protein